MCPAICRVGQGVTGGRAAGDELGLRQSDSQRCTTARPFSRKVHLEQRLPPTALPSPKPIQSCAWGAYLFGAPVVFCVCPRLAQLLLQLTRVHRQEMGTHHAAGWTLPPPEQRLVHPPLPARPTSLHWHLCPLQHAAPRTDNAAQPHALLPRRRRQLYQCLAAVGCDGVARPVCCFLQKCQGGWLRRHAAGGGKLVWAAGRPEAGKGMAEAAGHPAFELNIRACSRECALVVHLASHQLLRT